MQALLKKYGITPMKVLKVSGLVLVAIFVLLLLSKVIGLPSITVPGQGVSKSYPSAMGIGGGTDGAMMRGYATGESVAYDRDYAMEEQAAMKLSGRNIAPETPRPGTTGDDAEEYEVRNYNAHIETRNKTRVCDTVADLKPRTDVIFEYANEHEHGCDYTFKVENDVREEILGIIESLDPRDLTENIQTIKRQIDDFTSEEEVLENKLESIEETLESALTAYDEITALAQQTQNAEALATIIDSRVGVIERLTHARINVIEQLDRLSRAKADQLDRVNYAYFYVYIQERKYVDGEQLLESWKTAVRDFVQDVNYTVQDITIGLFLFLLLIAQYALYIFVLLVVVKYGWRWGKKFWQQ